LEGLQISKYNEDMATHMELYDFENKLSEFNITIDDLVENSPKHSDTRLNAINIARHVQENFKLRLC
jgi:RNA polymerase sigma factor